METHKPSGGGRDDCWSDGATAVLIEAWGERHRRCNLGFLRHNEWKEVADAVNRRDSSSGKSRRSDVQCKNRIDTLKKKYKVEKAKSKSSPSTWPFFHRLDFLIGNRSVKNPNPNPKSRFNSADSSESSLDDESLFGLVGRGRKHKHRLENGSRSLVEEEEEAFRELTKAVAKFGEIYERIESSKQHQLMELERQRMEFTKELELQRMNMLIDAQLELEKSKRSRNVATATGYVQEIKEVDKVTKAPFSSVVGKNICERYWLGKINYFQCW